MIKTLTNANFPRNVILNPGRSFELDDLAKVICYQNNLFSIMHNKYFYGFEKEGSSAYFRDNTVQGAYFNYRYPFKEELIPNLYKALNLPLYPGYVDKEIRQEAKSKLKKDEEDKENEQVRVN